MIPEKTPPGIALFDMDGTLLAWDCQLLFRQHVISREPIRWLAVPVFLAFLPLAKLLGTSNMKRVFHCFLFGLSEENLQRYASSFAHRLIPSIYSELIGELDRHKSSSHFTILSSASPECYVTEVGKLLGFDLSLGTVMLDRSFFPDLVNHKGAEKVTRLKSILPSDFFHDGKLVKSHGYTDSCADLPMLAVCERSTVVNPGEHLLGLAENKQWEVIRPNRPWKSTFEKSWRIALLLLGIGRNPAKL